MVSMGGLPSSEQKWRSEGRDRGEMWQERLGGKKAGRTVVSL